MCVCVCVCVCVCRVGVCVMLVFFFVMNCVWVSWLVCCFWYKWIIYKKKKLNHNFGTELIDHIDVCDFMSPDKIRACILIRSSGVINCIYNFFTICDNNN